VDLLPLLPVSMLVTPSMVTLFWVLRSPLVVNCSALVGFSVPLLGTTPGTRVTKPKSERPLLAMFLIASASSVNERSPLSACSSLTRATTVMLSVISPTSRARMPVVSRSLAATTRLVRSRVLNPSMLAVRV
jgi:hypothetical protein